MMNLKRWLVTTILCVWRRVQTWKPVPAYLLLKYKGECGLYIFETSFCARNTPFFNWWWKWKVLLTKCSVKICQRSFYDDVFWRFYVQNRSSNWKGQFYFLFLKLGCLGSRVIAKQGMFKVAHSSSPSSKWNYLRHMIQIKLSLISHHPLSLDYLITF